MILLTVIPQNHDGTVTSQYWLRNTIEYKDKRKLLYKMK